MALGTTNISMSGVATELGYGPSQGNSISLAGLQRAAHYNIGSTTYAQLAERDVDAMEMGQFREYTHKGLIFKFTPNVGFDTVANVGNDSSATLAPPTTNSGTGHQFTTAGSTTTTTTAAGNTVYVFNTSGTQTGNPPTGDYAYFQSTATSNKQMSNWLSAGGVSTIVFWLYLDALDWASGANTCIIDLDVDDDPSNYPQNNPYSGVQFVIDGTGRCRWILGDGGGTATSNRRTFASSTNTMSSGEWTMWVIQVYGTGGSEVSTTRNYSWYGSESNQTLSAAGQFLSGSGGNIAWEHSSTADQDTFYINSGAQGGRQFSGKIGHILMFDTTISDTEKQQLFDRMKGYYF